MVEKVLQLKCSANQYPWGKQGSNSLAARLASKTPGTDFKIKEDTTYAEMWMGTYPDLPSYLLSTGEDLQHVIDQNADELLGIPVQKLFKNTELPYLPKVLSIAKALPLQLHPNKTLAAELHRRDPSQFTDPNHKPEIGLALTDFEAFCGWKPLKIIDRLLQLPPLQRFLPEVKKPDFDDQMLKRVVKTMLEASEETIAEVNAGLMDLPKDAFGEDTYIPDLLPRLIKQYEKCDNGTVVALITMNYMKLKPGQSVYVPADGIHAWLFGDIIECMARSNNVLNTGFCPRADRNNIDIFCSTLTFTPHDPEEAILEPTSFERSKNDRTQLYRPPLSEFSVLKTQLRDGESEAISALGGPSIVLVTRGEGTMKAEGKEHKLSEGYIFFVGYGVAIQFVASKAMQIVTSFCE